MTMRVLITGGTGFLGSHLARQLAADGHAVTVLRRPTSRSAAIDGVSVRHAIGDVGDLESLRRAAQGHEVVVHAAAGLTGPPHEARAYEGNVTGARNVVDACLTTSVRRLVHVSSVAAIGISRDTTPATEHLRFDLERSRLHYHVSKHRAERAIADGVARGLDAVIVNPAGLWGPFASGYRGADIVRAVANAKRVRYTAGGVCVVHVADVAAGIVAAIDRGVRGERYILGGDNLSFRDWMSKIAAALGVHPVLVPVPRAVTELVARATGPLSGLSPRLHAPHLRAYFAGRSTFYDSGKAERALGYVHRGFDEIVAECVAQLHR